MLVDAALPKNSTFAHGRNRVAYRLLQGNPVTQLLDYGCGNADFAIAVAAKLGVKVHACDIDADLVEDLKNRYGAGIDFFAVSDSEPTLPLKDGQVSVVTCCDVLEHMPPGLRAAALREIRRVLADTGALIVTTPHKGLLSAIDPENAKYYFPRTHKLVFSLFKGKEEYRLRYGGRRFGNFSSGAMRHVHFSGRELSEMLTATGFEVDEVQYFTLIYPLVKIVLWFAESLVERVWGADRLTALLWKVYVWDADVEPGKLACSIGIRARKTCSGARRCPASA
jgi:ubiquinone/menaquinone biosynthesis C-methylase UbiE